MDQNQTITIINWERYNPRTDTKRPSWFRCENNLLTWAERIGLDNDGILVWIYLKCTASQFNKPSWEYRPAMIAKYANVSIIKVEQAIRTLERAESVRVIADDPGESRTDAVQNLHATELTERTEDFERKRIKHPKLDFEALYKAYPRKLGKAKGIAKLEKTIKTQEQYDQVRKALEKYSRHVITSGTEEKYVQHFSTWVNNWSDWADADAGTVNLKTVPGSSPSQPAPIQDDRGEPSWDDIRKNGWGGKKPPQASAPPPPLPAPHAEGDPAL